MIGVKGIAEVPRDCFDCPFQLQFKDGYVDNWYNRRCVILNETIQYPKLEDCPLVNLHAELQRALVMMDEQKTFTGVSE